MDNIHKFSDRVIDYAERLVDVADAAQGRRSRGTGGGIRWLVLPAAGAGVLALVKSDFFTRQTKGVVEEAKSRASDLPDDLLSHVRRTSQTSNSNGAQRSRTSTTGARTTGPARKTNSRKKTASRRKVNNSAR